MRRIMLCVVAVAATIGVTACGGSNQKSQYQQVTRQAEGRTAYLPHNNVEFNNYNRAQELYDNPSTIIWCSTTWGNPNSPIVTVPVAGKLTSSTTSFFNPTQLDYSGDTGIAAVPGRSVDGMYHPNPPQYRYGFTPGGQYVDFFGMPTLCTTALTSFQRQATKVTVTVDAAAEAATARAEAALRAGTDPVTHLATPQAQSQAQRILQGANLGQ